MGNNPDAVVGETTIMKWRDGKRAAVGLTFDDSLWSHVDYVIPLLVRKGLAGSFWVNPATSRHGYGIDMWEGRAEELGMELCAHTMNHTGAEALEEADYEIGESARILRALRAPGSGHFLLFLRGGGTTWKITDAEMEGLIRKHNLHRGRGDGVDHGGEDKTAQDLVGYVKEAQADGEFHFIAFHGVGPYAEWLTAGAPAFEALVNYLAGNRDTVWNATCGEIHKYKTERQSAKAEVREAGEKKIRLALTSDQDPAYYDAALTLETRVPDAWKRCLVTQGGRETVEAVKKGLVRFSAVPGPGEITLVSTRRSAKARPGSKPKAAPKRFPGFAGATLFTADAVPPGGTVARELPTGIKDAFIGFSFKLGRDFSLPEYDGKAEQELKILDLADTQGQPLAAVNIYRQGRDLCLYALLNDNRNWDGLPGWPNIRASHLMLKPGREHAVLLRVREGYRDGGAELWLDGKLRCSFMRRDMKGRAPKAVRIGEVAKPGAMRGSVHVTGLKASGE